MLYIGRVFNMFDKHYDEIWICTRTLPNFLDEKFRPNGLNIRAVPELAPSRNLFHWYLSKKDRGEWNHEVFEQQYTPVFMKEMSEPTAKSYIKALKNISKTKDIFVCCFCKDESLCHRILIKRLVEDNTFDTFAVLVAGSRNFNDYDLLRTKMDILLSLKDDKRIVIIEGGAKGADSLARQYAAERNYECKEFPADWNKYGKSAGYRRNEEMHKYLNSFNDRGCVCFWDGSSRGTKHNFELCEKYHTQLRIVRF